MCVAFNHFLFLNATDRSQISSNRYRIQFDVDLYPLSYFANTPFNNIDYSAGQLNNMNYSAGQLNNMDYSVCIEQEYGFCGTEYSQVPYIHI